METRSISSFLGQMSLALSHLPYNDMMTNYNVSCQLLPACAAVMVHASRWICILLSIPLDFQFLSPPPSLLLCSSFLFGSQDEMQSTIHDRQGLSTELCLQPLCISFEWSLLPLNSIFNHTWCFALVRDHRFMLSLLVKDICLFFLTKYNKI